ncbi:MAG: DUF4870 domain-containing protein [Patescibacteria group bacterium]
MDTPPEQKNTPSNIQPKSDSHLMAAVSYVWLLAIVMLFVKRDDKFVQFHAKQAVVLLIISLVTFIPVIGWLIGFVAFIGMVIGFINAWQGKEYQIPLIYGWSQKINL